MPAFGITSTAKLATCHPDLVRLFEAVIDQVDCIVLEGHRTEQRQEQLVKDGFSKTHHSLHLLVPSRAVDVAPFPLDWTNRHRFDAFAAVVRETAAKLGIKIRWGGEFKTRDGKPFFDGPHYELADPKGTV